MSTDLAIYSGFDDIPEGDLRCFDGVWRMSHDGLARVMQMSSPHKLAQRIERHVEWLNRISRVATVATRPEGGGHEWTRYWLDQPQCIYMLAKSDMPIANDITVRVVKVFHRVTQGDLSTGSRMEVRTLEVAAREIMRPILEEQRQFHSEVLIRLDRSDSRACAIETKTDILIGEVSTMRGRVAAIESSKRREPRAADVALMAGVIATEYQGRCPCCEVAVILDPAGARTEAWTIDHTNGAGDNRLAHLWPVCRPCNQRLWSQIGFRSEVRSEFAVFQKRLGRAMPQQLRLLM